ncbi:restriction endonuclease subunit S [Hymenobacter sp. UV11]|uniref:restriction endonuclease subunit S n=1 Tax=Hymenobacter sp. UV11 TaxID=1849735 RepID=UPI00105EA5CB|nr:restriction endonuclease subunit S [Hymenobacter sp. UV11]TDN40239.1 hypothetical protein A8B98_15280 [Hymenobacter sp. UV11]TFZ64930.1 restriction endonuclease subunit S [Hymenobacter sp. UV11]
MKRYDEYMPTGVEWLPEIPVGWTTKRLKYVVDINANTLPETTVEEFTFRYLDIGNVTLGSVNYSVEPITFKEAPSRARRIVQRGDLLISTVRTYLKAIAQIEEDADDIIGSTGFAVLSARGELDKRFLFYLSTSEQFVDTISAYSTGVSYPAITATEIGNMPIWFPESVTEQRAIALFLDDKTAQIDQLITQKQQMLELLREERAALINHAVTKGLDAAAPLRDSGIEWLGEVPAHWEIMKTKHACSLLRDGTHQPPQRVEKGYPLLSVRNIVGGKFVNLDDDSQVSENDFMMLEKSFDVRKNDIVLAVVGATLGKVAIVEDMPLFTIQRSLAVFRPKPELLVPQYMCYLFQSDSYQKLLWSNVGFSAQPGIYLGALSNFDIAFPPYNEQAVIIDYLKAKCQQVADSIATINQEIALLQEYRSALIAEAVTGQIDVRYYEPALEANLM